MSRKEKISDEIADIKQEIESYVQNKIDLTKLHVAEDLSKLTAGLAVRLLLFYIAFFVLLFLSMAAAYAIGSYTNNMVTGFIVVAGFYLLVGILFYLLRGILINRPIIKSFIHLFFPNYTKYEQ
ncbi:Putative Holin-X, holin superfamily III [Saccharicrinis carchari]|uniref:Holin-X, holin superfamily III n=1 Tax=Saccharicrinis carchari TaxID=1168039 RepID=A0A521AM89_SACCC|nr:phage holin family protein [Saccharicrinis carchari]SMO35919.1 Putative Holin-X, holin superfamily III [Saccharicrinis carchari]